MATASTALSTTEWTRVTEPGEEGYCWKHTGGTIMIDHTINETADTLPLSNTNVTVDKAKRVPLDEDNGDTLGIPADSGDDVYYSLAIKIPGEIVTDVK